MLAVLRLLGVLGDRHELAELGGTAVILQNLHAIEPMLDVRTLRNDHARVPFAQRTDVLLGVVGGLQVIERRNAVCARHAAGIRLVVVRMGRIKHLILLTGALELVLVVEVLHAAVGGPGETEVELEGEVLEHLLGDDVAAAATALVGRQLLPLALLVDARTRQHGEDAVLDFPSLVREGLEVPTLLPTQMMEVPHSQQTIPTRLASTPRDTSRSQVPAPSM